MGEGATQFAAESGKWKVYAIRRERNAFIPVRGERRRCPRRDSPRAPSFVVEDHTESTESTEKTLR
jgi:hypothetical protein